MKTDPNDFKVSTCPMTKLVINKYQISESHINKFCAKGCSVHCGEVLRKYISSKKEVKP